MLGIEVARGRFGQAHSAQGDSHRTKSKLRKIATEEACTFPEIASALRDVARAGGTNLDLPLLTAIDNAPTGTQPRFLPELLDLETQRLEDMDRHGVDVQLLSLTAPGVQMFDADTGSSLAMVANDRLAGILPAELRDHDQRC